MKLKVCGMKLNTSEVAQLRPDYLGFIFWEHSTRFFDGALPEIPHNSSKIGVFVDAEHETILEKVKKYQLQGIQLHGNENPHYCATILSALKKINQKVDLIKVFSLKNEFDFKVLLPFEEVCDYYLFDTKGRLPGGNGYTFDWSILKKYPSVKPYFLSGGIGLEHLEEIAEFMQLPEARYCHAIDVNSKFESKPGFKQIEALKTFKKALGSQE